MLPHVAACCRPGYLCSSGILMVDALVAITAITAMRSWALLQRRWAGMAQWAWGLHGQVQLVPGQVRGLCCTARLSLATCMLRVLGRLSLKKGQNRSYPIYFISMIYIAVLFLSNRVMRIARCYSAEVPNKLFCIYALHDEGRRFSRFSRTNLKHFAILYS